MVTVGTTDDDRRWAEAEALAAGVDDAERRRARRNRAFLVIAAILVATWVLTIAVALVTFAIPGAMRSITPSEDGLGLDGRLGAALVVEGVGLVTMVVGFVWAVRTGRYILRWRSIASPLTRAQRKQAQRAIAGKATLEPDRTRYLVALAAQNRRTTEGMTPIYGGIALVESASVLLHPTPFAVAVALVVGVAFAVLAVQLTLAYRRSGRYLATHGEEEGRIG